MMKNTNNVFIQAIHKPEYNDTNPRIQPEPCGTRGYAELRAIQKKER